MFVWMLTHLGKTVTDRAVCDDLTESVFAQ